MGATDMAQMNVRIPTDDKAAGDALLAKSGITPSAAIRRLWRYFAEKKSVPPFMADCLPDELAQKAAADPAATPEYGLGLAARMAADAGLAAPSADSCYDDLKEMAFEEWLLDKRESGTLHV